MSKFVKKSTGTVSITAEHDGRHEYCFSNQMSTVVDKIVRCVNSILASDVEETDGLIIPQLQCPWRYLC